MALITNAYAAVSPSSLLKITPTGIAKEVGKEIIDEGIDRLMDPANTSAQKKDPNKGKKSGEQLELPFDEDDDDSSKPKTPKKDGDSTTPKKDDDDDDPTKPRKPRRGGDGIDDKCLLYAGYKTDGYYMDLDYVLNKSMSELQKVHSDKIYYSKRDVNNFIKAANQAYDDDRATNANNYTINLYTKRGDEYMRTSQLSLSYKVGVNETCDVGDQSVSKNKRHDSDDDDDDSSPKPPTKKPKPDIDGIDGGTPPIPPHKGKDGDDGDDGLDGQGGAGGKGGKGGKGGDGGDDGDDGDDGRGRDGRDGKDGTNSGGGGKEDKDGDEEDKAVPAKIDCKSSEFHKEACEYFDWVDDEPKERKDTKVDVEDDEEKPLKDDVVDVDGTCPPPEQISITMPWGYSTTIVFDYSPYCDFAKMINPYMVASGGLMAFYLVSGVRKY